MNVIILQSICQGIVKVSDLRNGIVYLTGERWYSKGTKTGYPAPPGKDECLMDGPGSSRLAAWVLVGLLILGIIFFNVIYPPAELTNGVQGAQNDVIPVVGETMSTQVPLSYPTQVVPDATQIAMISEATASSIQATQAEVIRQAGETEIEATRQVSEATLAAQITKVAIRQSEMDITSTQVAIEATQKVNDLNNQQHQAVLRVSVIMGVSLACGLFLISLAIVYRLIRK